MPPTTLTVLALIDKFILRHKECNYFLLLPASRPEYSRRPDAHRTQYKIVNIHAYIGASVSGIFFLTELCKMLLPRGSQLRKNEVVSSHRSRSVPREFQSVKQHMNRDTVDASKSCVELNDTDIPGAHLDEPLEAHNVTALRWWLLCRGIRLPASLRKHQIIAR